MKTQLEKHLPPITASFCEFRHAFYNILENALKFNETGGVTVKARRDGEFVEIDVEDTGIEFQRSIYAEFLKRSAGKYNGSGLGLAVTKDIIRPTEEESRSTAI